MNASIGRGRHAARRGEWETAHAELTATPAGELSLEDLDTLFVAAWMVGQPAEAYVALQAAHQRLREIGDGGNAAIQALWLGFTMTEAGDTAVGNGWIARARRLAASLPESHLVHGYLELPAVMEAVMGGDYAKALSHADRALSAGQSAGDTRLTTIGVHFSGRACIRLGRVAEGLTLLDESMVAVVADELDPVLSGKIYCGMVEACHEASDWQRAQQWTEALSSWCDRQHGMVPFTGQCLVHRSEVLQIHGHWDEALQEARAACDRFAEPDRSPAAGAAWNRLGEMHRLAGRWDEADDAYRRALALGNGALPGTALLSLARRDSAAAVKAIRAAIEDAGDPSARLRLLPAQVEILLTSGDLEGAAAAADELVSLAVDHPVQSVTAVARLWKGAVLTARGEGGGAAELLLSARRTWIDADAPYLAARAGEFLASAYRLLGRNEDADLELRRSREVYAGVGATPDEERVTRAMVPGSMGQLTRRQLEVLVLVAAGLTNAAIAAELYVSVKTVDRHVSDIFARLGVGSRAAATAYAYQHGLVGA